MTSRFHLRGAKFISSFFVRKKRFFPPLPFSSFSQKSAGNCKQRKKKKKKKKKKTQKLRKRTSPARNKRRPATLRGRIKPFSTTRQTSSASFPRRLFERVRVVAHTKTTTKKKQINKKQPLAAAKQPARDAARSLPSCPARAPFRPARCGA
jgi:hypothetical protein